MLKSGVGGYTPLAGKILNIPLPEDFGKIYFPSAAGSAAAIFLAEFRKLTLI